MPSFLNSSLSKYEDKYFTTAIGRFSFSAYYHNLAALGIDTAKEIDKAVLGSTFSLLEKTRSAAPYRTGKLRSGLIVLPSLEKSKKAGKVVHDIVFDASMNDVFVKESKSGIRYYYPASQEYGFDIANHDNDRVPGKYFMRNTAIAHYAAHEEMVIAETMRALEEL